MRILALSGSLRAAASNSTLLRAAIALAPTGVAVEIFDGIANLPHFNPDLDDEANPHPAVQHFRSQLKAADGVVISSPEYAHGMPGVLKNALDWVVGSGEFSGKPVGLLNASPVATHAHESLREVLKTMDARVIDAASVRIPLAKKRTDVQGIIADPVLSSLLSAALTALVGEMSVLRDDSTTA
ncbi:NADPH-dependent FMN reductase [Fimbriiglobus ruber]|uniref:NADPH-dependent FMN reductase n=1 Tax=Fimbriiglobus ruber TaxID=1908690 RepID=A0A225DDS3_9BACT|nr:NAD(P)H-dependent oxidoreductase [Fimbriiglobus ruber]OWK39700.1 NADPH-dependent FMN reductase [Fimbriiglobus ruber]